MTHGNSIPATARIKDGAPATRKVQPAAAAVLNFIGPGLGYLYLGHTRLAIGFPAVILGFIAAFGWSGLVFKSTACYVAILLALSISLAAIVHSAVLAVRNPTVRARRYNRVWIFVAWLVAVYVLLNVVVANRSVLFGYQSFRVPAESMRLTFQPGDFIVADSWHYQRNDPQFGDIVVYRRPGGSRTIFLSRIVGLPGDSLALKDNVLYRDGNAVNEPYVYLYPPQLTSRSDFPAVTVPAGSVWLMSDNRHNAMDSRMFGPLSREALEGLVVHRWFAYDGGILWERFPAVFDSHDR